MFLCSQVC